ncbi:MAG: hypothetical protein HY370_08280 [Proteobacteria bacterium]|nr:hypothetical protein [Pseudomonadota bacterium]
MFSKLDAIFRALPRQAESTDARLGIRRDEEREEGRKNKEHEEKPDETDLWQDSTVVSVAALRAFLENLAGEAVIPATQPAESGGEDAAVSSGPATSAPLSPAAHAAQTYKSAARRAGSDAPPAAVQSEPPTAGVNLSLEEVRAMHALVDDLAFLAEKGVLKLNIPRGESFLKSIMDAVALAKRGFTP